ncbi:MAG: cation:proton antiporter [Burkholderiaceae bacterium]|nr:cation:proton antiporter [Sulfuritalea sp.]MCF8176264.1 cation:proton antiporter [Burkholderiaceae bacterium]
MLQSVFSEFALLLMISAAAGATSLWLRQPVLIAYIVVGIVAGPAVLGVVTAHDQIDLLAQIGVAILLFVVGLKCVSHFGPVMLAAGMFSDIAWSPLAWAQLIAQREYLQGMP